MILMSGIEHVRINDQLKAERIISIGVLPYWHCRIRTASNNLDLARWDRVKT